MFDEDLPKRPATHVLGADLSKLSTAELEVLIGELEAEIERVKQELSRKSAQKSEADSVFKS